MLAGGQVRGGQIAGQWPGLSSRSLYEGRDLAAVNDYESLFKGVLMSHLGMDEGAVERDIFPGSGAKQPMDGLFRV